jgi:hypothetical protein
MAILIKPKSTLGRENQVAPAAAAIDKGIQKQGQPASPVQEFVPPPAPPVESAKDRVDAGIAMGQKWVNEQVPDGVLGRYTDSYRPQVDNLIGVQKDNLSGYDSQRMQGAARDQAAALAGAGRAFAGKVGGAGAVAMAPALQNANMQYASGLQADNFDAKQRALAAASEYLPRAAAEELKMDQGNQKIGQKEKTLQATLPLDIAQLIEGTRNGILGNNDADWLLELTKNIQNRTGMLTKKVDQAQGR